MADFDTTLSSVDLAHPLSSNVVGGFHARSESAGNTMVNVVNDAVRTFTDNFTKNPDGSVSGTGTGIVTGDDNRTTIATLSGDAFQQSMMFFIDVDISVPTSGNSACWFLHIPNSRTGGTYFTFQRENFGNTFRFEMRSAFNTEQSYETAGNGGRSQYVLVYTASTRQAELFKDGVSMFTRTFTDGGNDNFGWYATRLGLGGPSDKYYASIFLAKYGDFSESEINAFKADPYAIYESEGGAPSNERFGTLSVVAVALTDTVGTKQTAGSLQAEAVASAIISGKKSASGSLNVEAVAESDFICLKSAFGTLDVTTVGSAFLRGYKSALGTLPVTNVALADMPGTKQAFGTLSVTAVTTASIAGSALDIRYGTLAVTAVGLGSLSGTKQTAGTLTTSAAGHAEVNAFKTNSGTLATLAAASPALVGYKLSFGTLSAAAVAKSTLSGYSDSTPTYFTSYRIEGVLQSVTIQAVLESTTLQGEI